ncbi:MAG: hypothetical protein J6K39_02390 [Clostridia bacterium]|nr:hypothetical protein [Clostridia bacterium]
MTVKEIIKLVCEFVGESEIFSKFSQDSTLNEVEQEKVDRMLRCFNLVNQEIASDYLPFLTKENVEMKGDIINFADLSKRLVNIYEVRNRFGMSLKFKLFPNYVEVAGKAKSVTYSFLPDEKGLEDDVEMMCGLSERVYAYGIASEYLLIDGVSEDAEIWESRFKESLFMLSRRRGEHILPKRRWL